MATACIAHSALQVHGISKPIIAKFDQPHASSDGGAILLKAIDDWLGLTWLCFAKTSAASKSLICRLRS